MATLARTTRNRSATRPSQWRKRTMELTERIVNLSKRAMRGGKKEAKKVAAFLKSDKGRALVKAVLVAIPTLLEALPQTKKVKRVKRMISKLPRSISS